MPRGATCSLTSKAITIVGGSTQRSAISPQSRQTAKPHNLVSTFPGEGHLRQPAITVAPGVTEAAVLHLRSLVARLRLANQEFHQAARKLEELCTALRETQPSTQDRAPS